MFSAIDGAPVAASHRVRVAATLIRVRDQVQIWTAAYERAADDLLGLQVELGRAIARQIQLRLSPQSAAAMTTRQTTNPAAYDLYLRGRHYYVQMTAASVARALECFQRATTLDLKYALAWAGIADTYSSRLFNSDTRPSDVAEPARAAASMALDAGDGIPEAHTSSGIVHFLFDWDWTAAEAQLRRALAIDPSSVHAHWMLGHALSLQARHDEALAAASRPRPRPLQRPEPQHVVADRVLGPRFRRGGTSCPRSAPRRTQLLDRLLAAWSGPPAIRSR